MSVKKKDGELDQDNWKRTAMSVEKDSTFAVQLLLQQFVLVGELPVRLQQLVVQLVALGGASLERKCVDRKSVV